MNEVEKGSYIDLLSGIKTRALPEDLKPSLPTVEELESELAEKVDADAVGETGMMIREWAERYGTRRGSEK